MDSEQQEIIHKCPAEGKGTMPCCGRTPFEAPRTDRISEFERYVTCSILNRTSEPTGTERM